MARLVVDSVQARGSLAVDAKDWQNAWGPLPRGVTELRMLAWDEDATTLAIEAASALDLVGIGAIALGPRVELDTLRVALALPSDLAVHRTDDPLALARALPGRVLALGADVRAGPPAADAQARAVAALIEDVPTGAAEPAAPRELPKTLTFVSPTRALQESRALSSFEGLPDSPMGAYVPWGTWEEDLPARLRLEAQRCTACGRTMYPPRGACPECRGRAFESVTLPRDAVVYAATRIGAGGAPSEFALEQSQIGAYWVAVVEWPEQGVRVTARLAAYGEGEAPRIGDGVRAVVRRLFEQEGKVRYATKFARVDPSSQDARG